MAVDWLEGYEVQTAGGQAVRIPVFRFGRGRDGPALAVVGGIHGDEYTGIAACYSVARTLSQVPDEAFPGTVSVYPMVNPAGGWVRTRWWPLRSVYHDLNRAFPGDASPEPSSGLCRRLVDELCKHDFVIDVHSSAGHFLEVPHLRVPLVNRGGPGDEANVPEALASAVEASNLPFALAVSVSDNCHSGQLSELLARKGTDCVVVEGGTAGEVDTRLVDQVAVGILGVAERIGAVAGDASVCSELDARLNDGLRARPSWYSADEAVLLFAERAGLFEPHSDLKVGGCVTPRSILGFVTDVETLQSWAVLSEQAGYILSLRRRCPVHKGGQVARTLPLKSLSARTGMVWSTDAARAKTSAQKG